MVANSSSVAQERCHESLDYLSSRLPSIGNAEVQSIRSEILGTNIMQVMVDVSSQGYTPDEAVSAILAQAREFDKSTEQALISASSVDSFGQTDDEFLSKLKSGQLNIDDCGGIRNSSLCTAAITKIGAIANRAIAAELQCHIRAGTWPN
ncbi:hypothetical protein [Stutzerimonas frequens]|uniref:hypothetical protein n=1 Tax=Stutzerimonas frequens TaxID=2968969 RepID=UPI0022DD9D6B|nr:hypothetical protein [Stutzerimonas frequens]MDA0426056.1 hypothetical protein [Stutzerimonas frequens]